MKPSGWREEKPRDKMTQVGITSGRGAEIPQLTSNGALLFIQQKAGFNP